MEKFILSLELIKTHYTERNKISKYEYIFGHYRRFINIGLFKKEFKNNGFKIKFMLSSFNLAKFKTENPHICRMILVKKTNYRLFLLSSFYIRINNYIKLNNV